MNEKHGVQEEELVNWFRDQERYWIGWITSHNSPCYYPMILTFTVSRKTTIIALPGIKIAERGKDFVRLAADNARKEGDDLVAVIYYFHSHAWKEICCECPVKRTGMACSCKITILNFHLFSRFKDTMLDHARYVVMFHEGKTTAGDDVKIKELKDTDGEIDPDGSLQPLWENPFA